MSGRLCWFRGLISQISIKRHFWALTLKHVSELSFPFLFYGAYHHSNIMELWRWNPNLTLIRSKKWTIRKILRCSSLSQCLGALTLKTGQFATSNKWVVSVSEGKRKAKDKISRKQVRDCLSQQDVYTLFKPGRRCYKRRRVIVPRIDAQFQAELVDLQNLSRYNKDYKYLLTCMDIFGEYAFVLPLKTQQGEEIDHVDLQQSRIAKDKQEVKAMVDLLQSNRTNPLSSYQPLFSISMGATVSPEIERDLSRACLVGETAYQQFKKGRFKPEKPPVNVHHTLTKQKLKTFSDFNKTKDVKKSKGNKRVIRADLNLFARMIIIAESRQLQMQEVLLGVLENVRQDERLALACAAKEYLRRISIIWSSPLIVTEHRQLISMHYRCCGT